MKLSNNSQRLAAAAMATIAIAYGTSCVAAPPPANAPVNPAAGPFKTIRVASAGGRPPPPGSMMLRGYMTLHNDGKTPMRFPWAQSDPFGMVQLDRSLIV